MGGYSRQRQKFIYQFQPDFGTDMGICDWITPNFNTTSGNLTLASVTAGSETGSNNGLQIILDAETFDYGTPTE